MEDEIRLEINAKDDITYAAVFDGHGGQTSALWLQEHLYGDVISQVDAALLQPEQVFNDIFQEADRRLIQYLHEKMGRVTGASGATGTVALLHPQGAVFSSLGDSLAVLCRCGTPAVLTCQHRVYGFGDHVLAEIQRVEAAGGWIVDGRVCNVLAVSRAFGDPEFKGAGLQLLLQEGAEKGSWPRDFADTHTFTADPVVPVPDVCQVVFDPATDEFLVIATDGLWDCMPPVEACRFARQQFRAGKSTQQVADALVDIALKRYTTDNVAVIVCGLKAQQDWVNRPAAKRMLPSFFKI